MAYSLSGTMPYRGLQPPSSKYGWLRFAAVIGLHVAILVALLHYTVQRSALMDNVITVSLMSEPQPQPPEVRPPEPPKPVPKRIVPQKLPEPPKQIIVAQTTAPAVETAPATPPPEPAPLVAAPVAEAPVVLDLNAAYAENPHEYPELSIRLREEGRVMLLVTINEQGLVEKCTLEHSSGHPRLDASALEQVRHWKFRPPTRAGHPVSTTVLVPVSFNLSR